MYYNSTKEEVFFRIVQAKMGSLAGDRSYEYLDELKRQI